MKDMKCYIYKITSPSGKIYIGQTRNLNARISKYKNLKCKRQFKILNSLKKYGFETHIFETIEQCEFLELNNRERYWQDFYDVLGKNGLNCILTRTDELPTIFSQETRDKISKAIKGKKLSKKHIEIIRKTHTGRKASEETKKKIGFYSKNRKASPETIEKLRKNSSGENNPMYGKKHSEESKLKMGALKGSKHNRLTILNTETGIYYDNITEAAFSINAPYSRINEYLRGKWKNRTSFIKV
jgi:group I intron endonuclease